MGWKLTQENLEKIFNEPENLNVSNDVKKRFPNHNWKCDRVVVFCYDCGIVLGTEKSMRELEKCKKNPRK